MKLNSGAMKGDAIKDVAEHAVPLLRRMLLAVGLAPADWQFIAKDCHRYGGGTKRPAADLLRIGQDNRSSRHIDVRVYPASGLYEYSGTLCAPVAVTAGQVLIHWNDLLRMLRDFCESTRKVAERAPSNATIRAIPEAAPEIPAPSAPPEVARIRHIAARVTSMKSGLDTFLTFAAEAEAGAELKAEAHARVTRIREQAAPLAAKEATLAAELAEAEEKANTTAATFKSLRARLAEAESDFKSAELREGRCKEAWQKACAAAQPLVAELRDAEAQLAECERLEAERAKAMSAAPGMAQLLAALEVVSKEPTAALVS